MNTNDILLFSEHFSSTIQNKNLKELVGQKGKGLLGCVKEDTPPFAIITFDFFREYLNYEINAKNLLVEIAKDITNAFDKLGVKKLIVRSSAKIEGFDERGFYESIENEIQTNDLKSTIELSLAKNKSNVSVSKGNEFALIIQQLITPKLLGHLSNERRVSRNRTDWLLEIVNEKGEFSDSVKFDISTIKTVTTPISLYCSSKQDLIQQLKVFAAHSKSNESRFHYEWVWDGARFWIVQKDIEGNTTKGTAPGSNWSQRKPLICSFQPKVLHHFKEINHNWKKIECVETFKACRFPQGDIYALEGSKVITELIQQKRNEDLTADLSELLQYPIVIRMDIATSDNYGGVLLPRTETIFSLKEAFDFLQLYSKIFSELGVNTNDFCFLIHRFIISKSCALAFAKPRLPRVRIDSTWGIVDGLYYHPHDSFEFNSTNKTTKKKIRCKTEYLDVDETGKWFSKKSGSDWDWAESLNALQIKEISSFTTAIANFLDKSVTVMYFVDVDVNTGYPSLLPWFYTTEEIPDSSEKFTDVIFSGVSGLVTCIDDFELLKEKISSGTITGKFSIKIKLNPDILREKHFIESIGNYCKEKNISVELDGSILSHTYYILKKCGARVKSIDPFDPTYKKQKFYKLVRDHIPIYIESKGETAKTFQLEARELLKFLKGKAIEESYEFFWEEDEDKTIEELADIYEVIRGTCKIFGINIEELIAIADKKLEKKGGFEKGIFLLETSEEALIKVISHDEQQTLNLSFDENPILANKPYKLPQNLNLIQSSENYLELPYIAPSTEKRIVQEIKIGNQVLIIEYKTRFISIKLKDEKPSEDIKQPSLF
ncbi:MAG: nucleoside triphosphate pyrophosphohydrolase [Candidatus Kapabacteria bacterium]|nr:nucleoside triphosphate pyrophosphohydrolase [Candidatus Kapabacteria bacterium]